jgi:hypothetical protein
MPLPPNRQKMISHPGRPYVGFQLDDEGADRFYYLSSSNIGEALAVIVEGKVASAPSISVAVRSYGVISGDFTEEQVDEMIKVLRKDVRPVSSTAAPPTRRAVRTYLIPIVIFVLAVSIAGFLIYR